MNAAKLPFELHALGTMIRPGVSGKPADDVPCCDQAPLYALLELPHSHLVPVAWPVPGALLTWTGLLAVRFFAVKATRRNLATIYVRATLLLKWRSVFNSFFIYTIILLQSHKISIEVI